MQGASFCILRRISPDLSARTARLVAFLVGTPIFAYPFPRLLDPARF
jgi:hypothetical protein